MISQWYRVETVVPPLSPSRGSKYLYTSHDVECMRLWYCWIRNKKQMILERPRAGPPYACFCWDRFGFYGTIMRTLMWLYVVENSWYQREYFLYLTGPLSKSHVLCVCTLTIIPQHTRPKPSSQVDESSIPNRSGICFHWDASVDVLMARRDNARRGLFNQALLTRH